MYQFFHGKKKRPSMAHWTALFSFILAAALACIDIRLAVFPLAGFSVLSLSAPFFPRFGYYTPVISCNRKCSKGICLTFDDGPDPNTTIHLLDLLKRYHVRAVFFVTGQKAARHPDLISAILKNGHEIGNHTYSHDNFLMLRDVKTIIKEIGDTQREISRFSIKNLVLRPPVGITGPRLKTVIEKFDMYNITFSCRATDYGNRRIKTLAARILKKIKGGDIVMLHDVMPDKLANATDATALIHKKEFLSHWLHELETIITGIKSKGMTILPLSELANIPVNYRYRDL